jgi:hypothetical protein
VGMQHLEWVAAERGATHVAVSADEPRPVPFDVVTLSGLRVRTVMAIMGLVLAVTLAFPTIDVSVEPTAAASRKGLLRHGRRRRRPPDCARPTDVKGLACGAAAPVRSAPSVSGCSLNSAGRVAAGLRGSALLDTSL